MINFQTEYPIDNLKKAQVGESSLTVCRLELRPSQNTLMVHIPSSFPEYSNLKKGQNVYFIDAGNCIKFSTTEIEHNVFFDRRIQWYGHGRYKYLRVPLPIQLRKKYRLDNYKAVQLISKEDAPYDCIFL